MMMKKMLNIGAMVAVALAVGVGEARANFTYSVAPVTTSTNFGAGSNLTVTAFNNGATSGTLVGAQVINLAQITDISTTAPPATDAATIALAPLVVTINNIGGGGSGSFTVNGNFVVTRSDTGGAISSFSPGLIAPPTLTLGTFAYTLSSSSYAPPTIGGGSTGNGSLSYMLTEVKVPEPMSLAAVSFVGFAILRRKRSSASC